MTFAIIKEVNGLFKTIDHPYNYRNNYTKNISVHRVPENHEIMFNRENVDDFAKKIVAKFKESKVEY